MGDRWAQTLLGWSWRGNQLEAEISRGRYFVRGHGREVLAHAELRDVGGRRRIEIGSYPSVALARAACERDAQHRLRRQDQGEEPGAVDIRISERRVRRR
jgi:hypothetical protein